MANIKTLNEIIISLISEIHNAIPEADTKEGTFIRDAIINPISAEIANAYGELQRMDLGQSILTAIGEDLDKLAANFFIKRKEGTKANGVARFYLSNTQIANLSIDYKYSDVYIPKGTILSTQAKTGQTATQFEVVTGTLISGDSIHNLERDESGYQYIDLLCECTNIGLAGNIGSREIVSMSGTIINGVEFVTNVDSFKNGSDEEDDMSLALRVSLALFGSNIGTKNGYLSYILKQSQVVDAKVIGSGDPEMHRDKVIILDDNNMPVEAHPGGCVDIYVRTNTVSDNSISRIIKDKDFNIDENIVEVDISSDLGEFLPIIEIRSIIGSKIINGIVSYTTYSQNDTNAKFEYGVYTDTDRRNDLRGSIKENCYIKFNGNTKPELGEKLEIKYTYNNGIKELQGLIENNKVLTADVLIKAAQNIDVNLYLNTKISKYYSIKDIESTINDAISTYINGKIKLGSNIDISDIVYIVKGIDGIKTIDMSSIGFSSGDSKELVQNVECKSKQYINLKQIIMNTSYED